MGEFQNTLFSLNFNRSVKIEARRQRLTGDAGAALLRELMGQLGIDVYLAERLEDARDQPMVKHPQVELVRTALLLLSQGRRDLNDAEVLRHDPVLRLSVSECGSDAALREAPEGEAVPDGLASQATMSRLLHALSSPENLAVLEAAVAETATRRVHATNGKPLEHATIDIDSIGMQVHGQQDGAVYNRHFGYRGFHPIIASVAEPGDLLATRLREGNVHTADGASWFIHEIIDRVEGSYAENVSVRIDAGFPNEPLLSGLEQRGVPYVCRVRRNAVLERMAEPLAVRPPGRPPTSREPGPTSSPTRPAPGARSGASCWWCRSSPGSSSCTRSSC